MNAPTFTARMMRFACRLTRLPVAPGSGAAPGATAPLAIAAAMAMVTALTGCQATTDARWATPADTVYHWQHTLPTLPVEVRGELPQVTQNEMLQALPQAAVFKGARSDAETRLVVEAGNTATPVNDDYCAVTQARAPNHGTTGHTDLMLSLCDGKRLVGWSHVSLSARTGTAASLPHEVARLETLMLIGIDRSPAQYVDLQR